MPADVAPARRAAAHERVEQRVSPFNGISSHTLAAQLQHAAAPWPTGPATRTRLTHTPAAAAAARPCSQRPSSRASGALNGLAEHSGALFGPADTRCTPVRPCFSVGRRREVRRPPLMFAIRLHVSHARLPATASAAPCGARRPERPPACAALPFPSLAGVRIARQIGRGDLGRGAAAPDSRPAATAARHRRSTGLLAAG